MNFEFGIPDDPHEECRHAIHELESELAQLREDAARYRWIRDNPTKLHRFAVIADCDATIDKLIEAAKERE